MRFKLKPSPKAGDCRIRRRFLWLPLIHDGVLYFWETVWVKERYWMPDCQCHSESCSHWVTLAVLDVNEKGEPVEYRLAINREGLSSSLCTIVLKPGHYYEQPNTIHPTSEPKTWWESVRQAIIGGECYVGGSLEPKPFGQPVDETRND